MNVDGWRYMFLKFKNTTAAVDTLRIYNMYSRTHTYPFFIFSTKLQYVVAGA